MDNTKKYKIAIDTAEIFSIGGTHFAGDVKKTMMDPLNELLNDHQNYKELKLYLTRKHANLSSALEQIKTGEKVDQVQVLQLEASIATLDDLMLVVGTIEDGLE